MHFFQFFKSLVGQEVIVELKNDLQLRGTLVSVDQYLNVKLNNLRVEEPTQQPHLASVNNCFIRGSVVRYIHLPKDSVDLEVLHDATRRNHRTETK